MAPDDPRHGTHAGYQKHRMDGEKACPPCLAAAADYRRSLDARHYLTGYQRLDATGTVRRIEALVALGYTWEALDDYLSRQHGTMSRRHHQWVAKGARVNRPGAAEIAAMYDALSMKVPPDTYGSRRAKARARRAGWLPPLAWDDDRIDDPTYRPDARTERRRRAGQRSPREVDEANVRRALSGERVDTTRAEKEEIMRRWIARGGSERELCLRMNWKPGRYVQSAERKAS